MTQVSTFNGLLVSFRFRDGQWFFACGLRFGHGATLFEAAALVLSERAEFGYQVTPRRETGGHFMTAKVTQLARKRRRVNPLVLARWIMRQKRP